MADTMTVSMRMPKDLVAQLDARAENLGISRTEWFENMVGWVLENTHTIESRGGRP